MAQPQQWAASSGAWSSDDGMDTWDPDCRRALFFLMSHPTHISFCPTLTERRNEPLWCPLAVRLPSPAHPLSSFLNLSFFIPYFSVSVFSPAGTGSQSGSPQRWSCHFPTGLIKGSQQCSPHSSNKHQFLFLCCQVLKWDELWAR